MEGHTGTVNCLDFNDKYFISGGWDGCCKVWERDGKLVKSLDGHKFAV